jgi:hypothetical protein
LGGVFYLSLIEGKERENEEGREEKEGEGSKYTI